MAEQKIKILHISGVKTWSGGGENHLENLLYELRAEAVHNIFCVRDSGIHQRLKILGETCFSAPLTHKMDPRFFLKLAVLCKKRKFDLIHIHDSTALTLTVLADHFAELPPFILSKKTSFPIRNRPQTLYKHKYPKVKKILCVSEATRKVAAAALKKTCHLELIYHGTRIDGKKASNNPDLRKKLNLPKDCFLIGNIANHIDAKDLETFVRTADFLINEKNLKNIHFVQIGNYGKPTEKILKLPGRFGLDQHISFLGYVPNAEYLLPQFNVNLITSENEGLPQVIYESFYYGTPVVSTNVGGIPEAIENGVNGLLSDVYDYKSLGENIVFLMENPQLIPNFVKISKEKLLRDFTSTKMAQKTLAVYKEVLNGD